MHKHKLAIRSHGFVPWGWTHGTKSDLFSMEWIISSPPDQIERTFWMSWNWLQIKIFHMISNSSIVFHTERTGPASDAHGDNTVECQSRSVAWPFTPTAVDSERRMASVAEHTGLDRKAPCCMRSWTRSVVSLCLIDHHVIIYHLSLSDHELYFCPNWAFNLLATDACMY